MPELCDTDFTSAKTKNSNRISNPFGASFGSGCTDSTLGTFSTVPAFPARQTVFRILWYAGACGVFLTLTLITYADNKKCSASSLKKHPYLKPDGLSPRDVLIGMSFNNCPRIAGFFGWCSVSCIFAAFLFDPYGSFSCKQSLHVWAACYGGLVGGISLIHVFIYPWVLIKICPSKFIWWSDFLHACEYACFIPAKVLLGHLVVLRIHRLNIVPKQAQRARKLLYAVVAVFSPWLPSLMLFTLVLGRPSLYDRDTVLFIHLAFLLIGLLVWALFQVQALYILGKMASRAWLELKEQSANNSAMPEVGDDTFTGTATLAVAEVCCLFLSFFTTVAFVLCWTVFGFMEIQTFTSEFMSESVLAIDSLADCALVILSSGLYRSEAAAAQKQLRQGTDRFDKLGRLAAARRRRLITSALVDAASAQTGPEMTLAAMLHGQDPNELIRRAIKRFRCIDWAVLREYPDIIIGGGPLEKTHTPEELFNLSQPCRLTTCDAFVSHSWHDDGNKKWAALKDWCEQFIEKQKRTPRLWLDRVCINQSEIQADLQCLPIFLAGCNQLFVASGPSYTTRLWCCLELFVYVTMKVSDASRSPPHVTLIGDRKTTRDAIINRWVNFDAAECQSFDPEDKRRIMGVIENHPGGLKHFNIHVKELATQLFAESLGETFMQNDVPKTWGSPIFLVEEEETDKFCVGEEDVIMEVPSLPRTWGSPMFLVDVEETDNFCLDDEDVIVEVPSHIVKERWRFSL